MGFFAKFFICLVIAILMVMAFGILAAIVLI
jgi:hypothetical protein